MPENLRFYKPCTALQLYVRYYWVFRSRRQTSVFTFPIGCPQIIFHRRMPLYIPETDTSQYRMTVSGQVNFSSHVCAEGDTDMAVVVLRPHAMSAFLGVPSSLFYNREADGEELENRELNRLSARISGDDDDDICIRQIEDVLLRLLTEYMSCSGHGRRACTAELNLRRAEAATRMLLDNPATAVSELASHCCLCRKQFERMFMSLVGINPKEYARIVRFQKALALMQKVCSAASINPHTISINYTRQAYESGYADQSHMIREFRNLCGLTPVELMRTTVPYSDLFTSPV